MVKIFASKCCWPVKGGFILICCYRDGSKWNLSVCVLHNLSRRKISFVT